MAAGVALLQQWGYRVTVFPHALAQWGYLAGTDAQRASDLVAALTDPAIDLVLCARGGYGCTRLLSLLPWDILAQTPPKLVVGFSDVTALLVAFYQRLGWLGLHGPMLTSNLIEGDPYTAMALKAMWAGAYSTQPVTLSSATPVQWLHGRALPVAPVLGGNLSLLAALCGTPWQPDTRGHILLIEDWKESYYSLDRQVQQLRQCGLLDGVAGLLLGDFSHTRADADWDLSVQWQHLTADLGVPVAYGFSAGHGDQNATIPIGATITLAA
jgi:muramoyltetrapeptide carboxypeptidase